MSNKLSDVIDTLVMKVELIPTSRLEEDMRYVKGKIDFIRSKISKRIPKTGEPLPTQVPINYRAKYAALEHLKCLMACPTMMQAKNREDRTRVVNDFFKLYRLDPKELMHMQIYLNGVENNSTYASI